jgi:hypothetical protein
MNTEAECDVSIVMSSDVEPVRVGKLRGIAIGGPGRVSCGEVIPIIVRRWEMIRTWTPWLLLPLVISAPLPARAQTVGEVFRRVNPSVVIIRARRNEPAGLGQVTKISEIGSGFLISAQGQVITAAHVVQTAE